MKSMATSDSYNAKPAEKAMVVKPSAGSENGPKKKFELPDFSKMTPAEKLQWNLERIRKSI